MTNVYNFQDRLKASVSAFNIVSATFDEQAVVGLDQRLANHMINQLDDFVLVSASMKTVASGKQIIQI